MHPIDWLLVIVPMVVVLLLAAYTNRYVKSVADFLAGGRCAGRYLLANARGQSDSGLANTMARFEIILISGFVLSFWEKISYPVVLLVGISGFVVYRYRETRAMTLAQFFEIRYTRRFRLYMGMLAFLAGILNYGIFPAISARFFIYFLDLPQHVALGPLGVPTFALIMAVYLSFTAFMVLFGGQATMMITCCVEGLLSQVIYVVIAVAVFFLVSWRQMVDMMAAAAPGTSMINPFDAGKVQDFNFWFIIMGLFLRIYSTGASQNRQGFMSAGRTPHEQRMAGVLGEWRMYARTLMLVLLALCAVTYLRHPAFSQQAAPIHHAIDSINDAYVQKQMTVPIALRYLLPSGIKGLFVSVMLMGLLAGDAAHLHSWGSIFVQDVMLPLQKREMSQRQHIWALRAAVTMVAVFAFLFSVIYPQTQFITLWWNLTGAVYTGGAGAAIIGGLYWKRGTTAAAWAAAITGSILCFVGIICGSFWLPLVGRIGPAFQMIGLTLPQKFWFNNQVSAFAAALIAGTVYLITSLLTSRTPFNLDQMLHRGIYAVEGATAAAATTKREGWRDRARNLLKFDSDFTFSDKVIAGGIFWWAIALVAVNAVICAWHFGIHKWPANWWAMYWWITAIAIPFVISLVTVAWFTIGGVKDMRDFYVALRTRVRDAHDDGRVVGHRNLADVPPPGFPVVAPDAAKPGESTAAAVAGAPLPAVTDLRPAR